MSDQNEILRDAIQRRNDVISVITQKITSSNDFYRISQLETDRDTIRILKNQSITFLKEAGYTYLSLLKEQKRVEELSPSNLLVNDPVFREEVLKGRLLKKHLPYPLLWNNVIRMGDWFCIYFICMLICVIIYSLELLTINSFMGELLLLVMSITPAILYYFNKRLTDLFLSSPLLILLVRNKFGFAIQKLSDKLVVENNSYE